MALSVSIVGAGWAGLACAIAAARAGAQVTVFDRREGPGEGLDDAALHVDVVPDMMRSLARLGVADACARGGFPYRSVTVTDGAGRLFDEIPCRRLAEPHLPVAVGLLSAVLTEALLETALALGVRVRWSSEVEAVAFEGDRALLQVDGRTHAADGLTLLATGGSAVCEGASLGRERGGTQVTWWCGLVPRPKGLDQPCMVLAGLRSKLWLAPLGSVQAGLSLIGDDLQAHAGPTLSTAQAVAWLQAHGCRGDWISTVAQDETPLRRVQVRAGVRKLPWHHGNLLCVGAAAHGLPPHFSQPAAQAFEDAVVLGELLAAPSVLPTLPQAFVQRRRPRVKAVFDVAARAMQWDRDPGRGDGLNELAASMASVVSTPA